MATLTLFSFGYHGWGNHTPGLIEAVDAAERARGFEPPTFVDIRIRRSVRAVGFTGSAFEKLLGPARHRWMKSLGNRAILTRTGPAIQIDRPEAADELLDAAALAAASNRRLLFFCSCRWPRRGGLVNCHRATVAELLLRAARDRGVPASVAEWPGGEPSRLDLRLERTLFHRVRQGRTTVPVGAEPGLAEAAGLAWGSIATLHGGGESYRRLVGPAVRCQGRWCLPVVAPEIDPALAAGDYAAAARAVRQSLGLQTASA